MKQYEVVIQEVTEHRVLVAAEDEEQAHRRAVVDYLNAAGAYMTDSDYTVEEVIHTGTPESDARLTEFWRSLPISWGGEARPRVVSRPL